MVHHRSSSVANKSLRLIGVIGDGRAQSSGIRLVVLSKLGPSNLFSVKSAIAWMAGSNMAP